MKITVKEEKARQPGLQLRKDSRPSVFSSMDSFAGNGSLISMETVRLKRSENTEQSEGGVGGDDSEQCFDADHSTTTPTLIKQGSVFAFGKEQLSEADQDTFVRDGISPNEIFFFTKLFHKNKRIKHLRGLTLEEFGASLHLDEFWSAKIFDKFAHEDRIGLFEFIYVCTTLRPCKTEKALIQKADLFSYAIADVSGDEDKHSVIPLSRVEDFVMESAKGLRVKCGNLLLQTGIEKLGSSLDSDNNGLIEVREVKNWLLQHPSLIENLCYSQKVIKGLSSSLKSRHDVVEDMQLKTYLEEVAFSCRMERSLVKDWMKKLKSQGISKTSQLKRITKQDWASIMNLPLAVYEKVCEDLNLIYDVPNKKSTRGVALKTQLKSIFMKFSRRIVLLGLIAFSIWLGVGSIDQSQVDVFGIEIYGARGSAGIILLFSFLIVFWVSYHSVSRFARAVPFNSYLLVHNQETHMISGMVITFFGVIHTICWCISYRRGVDSSQDDWNKLSGPVTNMREHWGDKRNGDWPKPSLADLHFSRAGITGWTMVVILLIMAFTSRTSFRKRYFNTFFNLHHLYIGFFVCIFLHGSEELMAPQKVWFIVLPFLALFILDKLWGFIRRQFSHEVTFNLQKSSHGTVRLDIEYPRKAIHTSLGQWVWINFPEISRFEWHPFTVANADPEFMALQIFKGGDWTGRLHEILQETPSKLQKVYVEGPVGTIGKNFLSFKHMILVGSGVGVTPYACIIDYFRRQLELGHELNVEKVYFVWLVRDQDCLGWYSELLETLVSMWDGFHLDVYLTSRNANELNALGYNMLATAMKSQSVKETIVDNPTKFHIGRPNFEAIFDDFIERHHDPKEHVGVFFCGNQRISQTLQDLVKAKSRPETCMFEYFPEFFT